MFRQRPNKSDYFNKLLSPSVDHYQDMCTTLESTGHISYHYLLRPYDQSVFLQVMIKSGSRASLLTNDADETDSTTTSSELKRYKSLPGDKLLQRRRRVKRRAPSPPKDQPRYRPPPTPAPTTFQPQLELKKQPQQPATLDLPKERDSLVSTGGVVGGVKLRRKKFQFFNRSKPM